MTVADPTLRGRAGAVPGRRHARDRLRRGGPRRDRRPGGAWASRVVRRRMCGGMPQGFATRSCSARGEREALHPRGRRLGAALGGRARRQRRGRHASASSRRSASRPRARSSRSSIAGVPVESAVVLLDGSHDWLTPALADWPSRAPRVTTRVKADRDCATVAAASVLAKVHRDRLMIEADARAPRLRLGRQQGLRLGEPLRRASTASARRALHRRSWLKQPALF